MKNKIVQALEHGAGKLTKSLGEDAGKAVKDFYHDTGHRLKRCADDHLENDTKIKDDLEHLAKRHKEETPVYHIDDDGNITRLEHDPFGKTPEDRYKKVKLTQGDKDRLGLDSASVGAPKQRERLALLKNDEENAKKPRPKKSSTKVAPASNDLAQATQIARHADKSYGTHLKDGKFTSNNYAAARVKGAGGKGDFIIVGRSHRNNGVRVGAHSERMIGVPFLRQGAGHRIQDLYTEREPCPTAPNCSSWMAERLPHVQAQHSFDYGDTTAARAAGNKEMMDYLDALKSRR
ncbi:nucleic acid/nucleotide deaminase domain-containing protein [Streptomyces sp. HPF1205]|uniref:nucleic acid/nucleotide deaminase domain-containing protein n=1 Tax=Streptomyces sp. HPF1205 TaxID=2873262 RepID=UPI001CECDE3D|nr:nucleic acid/nucleotide deaminase domain-containing protein [Streptomyces sp. HPF1205]